MHKIFFRESYWQFDNSLCEEEGILANNSHKSPSVLGK